MKWLEKRKAQQKEKKELEEQALWNHILGGTFITWLKWRKKGRTEGAMRVKFWCDEGTLRLILAEANILMKHDHSSIAPPEILFMVTEKKGVRYEVIERQEHPRQSP